jgi:hypothetical protein
MVHELVSVQQEKLCRVDLTNLAEQPRFGFLKHHVDKTFKYFYLNASSFLRGEEDVVGVEIGVTQ